MPQYIMWTTFFHIKDTYAALIFPNLLMTAFNIFLVRNYYSNSLPEALYEASELAAEGQAVSLPGNSIRMALAFVGILPIIIIYPMLQKYFIKGVVVGAVKG